MSLNRIVVCWEDFLLDYNVKVDPSFFPRDHTFYYLDYGHRDFAGNDSQYDQPPPRGNSGNGGSRCGPFKTWQSIYNYDIAFGLTPEEIKLVLGEEVA
uniref:Uncharacterized protein n=1 Tax=Salix viminalis TaxID=40686 RepID=A0A6N2LLM9_SALVM